MPKALFIKELRETIWIGLLAVLVHLYVVCDLGSLWSHENELLPLFAIVSACLAGALGFRQSLVESTFGTYLFLLNRPAARERLIATKLAVGVTLCLACSAMPIQVYVWWQAMPGSYAKPLEWSTTDGAWRICLASTLFYLGCFLTGIRPSRWMGTRLFPLLAAGVLAGLLVQVVRGWPVFALAVVLAAALLVVNIFFVARMRDY